MIGSYYKIFCLTHLKKDCIEDKYFGNGIFTFRKFCFKCEVLKTIDSDDKLMECHVDQNVFLWKLSLFKYKETGMTGADAYFLKKSRNTKEEIL